MCPFHIEPKESIIGTVRVLTVCSGNICRSPFAAALLASELGDDDVLITSAGSVARDDDPVTPEMLAIGFEFGVDLSAHRARYLTASIIDEADLILTMTRRHRREVVELAPRKVASTLTLREFARLAREVSSDELENNDLRQSDVDGLRAMLALVSAKKGHELSRVDPKDDDVVDPYRADRETYVLSATQIAEAVHSVSRVLAVAL